MYFDKYERLTGNTCIRSSKRKSFSRYGFLSAIHDSRVSRYSGGKSESVVSDCTSSFASSSASFSSGVSCHGRLREMICVVLYANRNNISHCCVNRRVGWLVKQMYKYDKPMIVRHIR